MWGGLSAVYTQNIYYRNLKYPAARCAVKQFTPNPTNNLRGYISVIGMVYQEHTLRPSRGKSSDPPKIT